MECLQDTPLWQACSGYFQRQFPACHKCQTGHEEPLAMLVHLTASHYQKEALLAFGTNDKCTTCEENLPTHKESFRQYYVISHMARHLDQLVTGEAKDFLLQAMGIGSNDSKKMEEKCDSAGAEEELPVPQNGIMTSDMSDKIVPGTSVDNLCKTRDNVKSSADTKQENDSVPLRGTFENQQLGINSLEVEVTKEDKVNSLWQDCQDHFRSVYPSCQTCKSGHRDAWIMTRHVTFVHCGKGALRLFGEGNACSLCQSFVLGPSKSTGGRANQIKSHMATHLEQFIPDEETKVLLLKAKAKSKQAGDIGLEEKSIILTKVPTLVSTKAQLSTLGRSHKNKSKAKKPKIDSPLKDCVKYFSEKYPFCETCQNGHNRSQNMRVHLTYMHCSEEAAKFFGEGNTCSVCNSFSLKPSNWNSTLKRQIRNHMAGHLELFFPDEKARDLLLRERCEASRLRILEMRESNLLTSHLQRCEAFFKQNFVHCFTCQRADYESNRDLVQHLFEVHYHEKILGAFGVDCTACQVCHMKNVVPSHSNRYRMRLIVRHFAKHHQDFMIKSLDSAKAKELISEALHRTTNQD